MTVVNMRAGRGVKSGEVRIDRQTKFGNPIKMLNDSQAERARVIERFVDYVLRYIKSSPQFAEEVRGLRGKTLACLVCTRRLSRSCPRISSY